MHSKNTALLGLLALVLACGDKDGADSGTSSQDTDDSAVNSDTETGDSGGGDTDTNGGETGDTNAIDPDADGDGYPASVDCDDGDATVNPGAVEVCGDGVDNNCDGFPDCTWAIEDIAARFIESKDDLDGRIFQTDYVGDLNGDGYKEIQITSSSINYSYDGKSIDTRVTYLLYGTPHLPSYTNITTNIYTAADVRIYGHVDNMFLYTHGVGDTNADGHDDVWINFHPDDLSEIGYLLTGGATSWSGDILAESLATAKLSTGTNFTGTSYTEWAGDTNADGYNDILIGIPYYPNEAGQEVGGAFLLQTPINGEYDLEEDTVAFIGEEEWDYAGAVVSGAGDVNGDGTSELLIANRGFQKNDAYGAVYLIWGQDFSAPSILSLADADLRISGGEANQLSSHISAVGDMDSDGYDDFASSAEGNSKYEKESGAVYVFSGSSINQLSPGPQTKTDVDLTFVGESAYDQVGIIGNVGDLDQNGHTDLLVCSKTVDVADYSDGVAYIVLIEEGMSGTYSLANADYKFAGNDELDQLGSACDGLGDVDGDGVPDLIVNSYAEDTEGGENTGAAYLLFGDDILGL